VDGGAELTASPEVVLDALAAAFFLPRFLPAMKTKMDRAVSSLNSKSPS
jgi:hypothetical protein